MTQFVISLTSILDLGSAFEPISHAFKSAKKSIQTNLEVNRTIKELSSLSDRELNDIGISRSMIRSIAMDIHHAHH